MRKSLAPSQRNKLLSGSPLSPKNFNAPAQTPTSSLQVCPKNTIPYKLSHSQSNNVQTPPEHRECPGRDVGKRIFSVVYGKPSKKKHKTWDGDGILEVDGKTAVLKDTNGKIIGQTTNLKKSDLSDGTILFVGSKEVEISSEIENRSKSVVEPVKNEPQKRKSECFEQLNTPHVKRKKSLICSPLVDSVGSQNLGFKRNFVPLIMPTPNDAHQWTLNPDNVPVVEVSVANNLCKVLRKHQREGVTFLYACVAGLRDVDHRGAILADEMGLGKTLQCITLVWTLLRQGPYGAPLLKKVLIVVPSSLVQNWKNEFTRWLGSHLVKPFVVDKTNRPKDFAQSRSPVLIVSYEMFVKTHDDVKNTRFDLLICDEGHRLKNTNIRAACLLNSLPCKSRILLTGTPIQNDLQEFYALVDFVNPGILGSPSEFNRSFEKPILASKEPNAPSEIVKLGQAQAEELNRRTSDFILRRTQELIGKYLPLKTEYVVFCEPSELQKKLYTAGVNYWMERMEELGSREMPRHLSVITALKKICNHPILLKNSSSEDEGLETLSSVLEQEGTDVFAMKDSSKMLVVDSVLKKLKSSEEKLILVSNFTQTLDLFGELCALNGFQFLRFDGSTPTTQRNDIVSRFNNPTTPFKVLLLSSKAGGVGLNLIGASRLILFDSDWNPATDLQAMARIWREGQKKNVHIYRLLTSGTIEEKIYQRQLKKTGLSESIVDVSNSSAVKLSNEELKDLFSYTGYDKCLTHDSLKCECLGDGTVNDESVNDDVIDGRECQIQLQQVAAPSGLRMNQLLQWEHHRPPLKDTVVCITIHRCEPLRLKDLHKRPAVRVHLMDLRAKGYRRSAFGKNAVDVVQTQQFDHIINRSVVPTWEEDLIFMEPVSHVVSSECVLIFELLEIETEDVIAWAFLKPLAANGKKNVGTLLRLQLYKPAKSRNTKTEDSALPLAFNWYMKSKMSSYSSTMLVSLHAIESSLVMRPDSPTVSNQVVPSKRHSRRRSSQMTSSPAHMKLSEAEKELIGVVWSRLPSLSCKLPNKVNSSLPAGPDGGMSVSYSRSGLLIACHTSSTISIFTYRGSRYLTLSGHHGLVYDLSWSPDDSFLLSASADTTACVWNIKLKQTTPVGVLSHPSYVYCATWVGPSLVVTGCYDRAIRLWDLAGVPTLLPQNSSVAGSITHPSSTYEPLQCAVVHKARVNSLAVLSSDEILVSGDSDGVLIFWKLSTTVPRQLELSREVKLRELRNQVINKVSAHPGGKRILVSTRDSTLRMIDLQSTSVIQWFHGGVSSKLQNGSCFCGCGSRVLSCSEDGTVSMWDANTGERIAIYKGLYLPESPATLTFHPKDNMFALVSHKVGAFPALLLTVFSRDASGSDMGIEWLDNRAEKLGSSSSVSDLSLKSSRESVAEPGTTRKKKKGILRTLLQGRTKSKHKKGVSNDAYTDTESGEGATSDVGRSERRKRAAYKILESLDTDGEVNHRLTDIIKRMDKLIMTASPNRPQVF